jgi:nucleolar protein 56
MSMEVKTWFGIFSLEKGRIAGVELFQKDLSAILTRLSREPLLLSGKVAGQDLRDLAVRYGFASSHEDYDRMLHDLNIMLVKKQLSKAVTPDRQIIGAIEALDDINRTANILSERLRELYILNFNNTALKGSELARHIMDMNETQSVKEYEMMRDLASGLLGLYSTRLSIDEYLKKTMQQFAPNLTNITGHLLGARMLSMAGSLEKLAYKPSSTIQVLGASSALFKHLKGKGSSPKHGVIFRHPYVNSAPKKLRGKIARAVSSKISLAARYDHFSKELKQDLQSELERKVLDIKKRHPDKKRES